MYHFPAVIYYIGTNTYILYTHTHIYMAFQYDIYALSIFDIVVVQPVSHVQLFVTPWILGQQASLFFTLLDFAQIHVH